MSCPHWLRQRSNSVGTSDYITAEEKLHGIAALFPNSQVATVPDAGHWVHAEKPQEVFELARNFAGQVR